MSEPRLDENRERLLNELPPGRLVGGPSQEPYPVVWLSDGPVRGAADWWARLYSRHPETGLYPLLLEYPDDSFEPGEGGRGELVTLPDPIGAKVTLDVAAVLDAGQSNRTP